MPKCILLATDLSSRGDRALDRAVMLARQWDAKLVVLHVLEDRSRGIGGLSGEIPSWRRPSDPASVARDELAADLAPLGDRATIIVEKGDAASAILHKAAELSCDLIITGIARDELLGRFFLGKTVARLLRRSPVPILIVKDRAQRPYHHVVVATDYSDSSRHALEAAAAFFPEQSLVLFHACGAGGSGTRRGGGSGARDPRVIATEECEAFLQSIATRRLAGWRPEMVIEPGAPDILLRNYARESGADLVVLGTHGRSALFEVILGSVAKQITEDSPCDALIVREPRGAVEA